jgi:hypothetical protein
VHVRKPYFIVLFPIDNIIKRRHFASGQSRYQPKGKMQMNKQVAKQIFGIPSLATASAIDDSDATHAACAAIIDFKLECAN